jgi:ubiquinone biosynthesis protein
VLFRHQNRIKEIADVLARYGFVRLADDAGAALDSGLRARLVTRMADPDLAALTSGERLRGALSELGTSRIKFGQMLSLHPDLVGNDVAAELAQLQSDVPPTRPVPPSPPSRPNSGWEDDQHNEKKVRPRCSHG